MKLKNGFMLREIAGQWVVVPLAARVVEFNGIMTLSESGATLWRLLEKGAEEEELLEAILSEYDVSREVAQRDLRQFICNVEERRLLA